MEREPRLLFVDDEEMLRKLFARELRLAGFAVTAVASGQEALAALEKERYEVVVTDLVMPEVDGLMVLETAKKLAPFTAVIILTGYGNVSSVIDALRLGADDYAQKPCEMEELVFRVRRCLEKRGFLETLALQNRRLEEEIARRKVVEKELEERVQQRTVELSEANTALTVLLKKREEDRNLLAEQVVANAANLIDPYLDRLKSSGASQRQLQLLDILRANIAELTSPFTSNFTTRLARLTPAEMQVANMVKLGKRTKEIAAIMHLAPGTISIHRKNIRKKLALTHQKANLQTALSMKP